MTLNMIVFDYMYLEEYNFKDVNFIKTVTIN